MARDKKGNEVFGKIQSERKKTAFWAATAAAATPGSLR